MPWWFGLARDYIIGSALDQMGWGLMLVLTVAIAFVWTWVVPRIAGWWSLHDRWAKTIGVALTFMLLVGGPSVLSLVVRRVAPAWTGGLDYAAWLDKDWGASLVSVTNKYFRDEDVLLDGKHYTNCDFENVTFVWKGQAPFMITHNQFHFAKPPSAPAEIRIRMPAKFREVATVMLDLAREVQPRRWAVTVEGLHQGD